MERDVLLILNRSAADGRAGERDAAIRGAFETHFGFANRRLVVVPTHEAVRAATRAFLASCGEGGVILSGGGAGTMRAVVEGLCAEDLVPPPIGRVVVAPLRLGSGNVLARTFGVAADPTVSIAEAAAHVRQGRIEPCSVMRCDVDGLPRFATTLIGLGQFGRIPGDLARFHQRWKRFSRLLATLLRFEGRTAVEYRTAVALRLAGCLFRPSAAEAVRLVSEGTAPSGPVRLLAGAIANVPISGIPGADSAAGRPELSGVALDLTGLTPRRGNSWRIPLRVSEGSSLSVRLLRSEPTPFFLDEDPMTFIRDLRVTLAGMLGIVPGFAGRDRARRAGVEPLVETTIDERSP